ncbi:hypothetical protein SISSUDRAFT_960512, partial [Sistotremastrum suecicum HHB10207 ss-3]
HKPVARKQKPVPGVMPEESRVQRKIPVDPLLSLSPLSHHPPSYQPSSKIPQELFDKIIANEDNFLWPEEVKLFGQVLNNNLPAIATQDSERGVLREDYFSDYIIPLVDHEPWVEKNIPIPPG